MTQATNNNQQLDDDLNKMLDEIWGDFSVKVEAVDPSRIPRIHSNPNFAFMRPDQTKPCVDRFLLDTLIPEASLSMIYGASESLKSFWAIDVGLSLASGLPFHGLETKQGAVLYVCAEGHSMISSRVDAWRIERDCTKNQLPFYISTEAYDFSCKTKVSRFISHVKSMTPSLIVIDTLARSIGEVDENSNTQMGTIISNFSKIMSELDCSVLLVHHSGHDATSRARGASALRAAVDVEVHARRRGSKLTIANTKMKDGAVLHDSVFMLKEIKWDKDEKNASSCVLIDFDPDAEDNSLSEQELELISIYHDQINAGKFEDIDNEKFVKRTSLLESFQIKKKVRADSKRRALDLAIKSLHESGVLLIKEDPKRLAIPLKGSEDKGVKIPKH